MPQRSILVEGEVKSPGRYGLEKSGERISDIIKKNGRIQSIGRQYIPLLSEEA